MNRTFSAWLRSAATLTLVLAAGTVLAAKPHQHGTVKLEVAIEGEKLSIAMEAPLDNLLGFERAPRSEAERQAAAEVLARLRSGAPLFTTDAAAQCTLASAEVQAGVLEPGAKPGGDGDHADLEAMYAFRCAQPQQLRTLQVGLFDAFSRIQRIDVQVVGPQGQTKATLKRPARTVKLGR